MSRLKDISSELITAIIGEDLLFFALLGKDMEQAMAHPLPGTVPSNGSQERFPGTAPPRNCSQGGIYAFAKMPQPQNREYIYGMHVITNMITPTTMMKIKVESINKLKNIKQDIQYKIYEKRGRPARLSYNDIIDYMLDRADIPKMANDIYRKKLNK